MKLLTWEQLQKANPKQTAIIVKCTWHGKETLTRTRVVVGGWMSREEAWKACCDRGWRGVSYLPNQVMFEQVPRLLRLNKVIKEWTDNPPRDASAWKAI